jgi:hypothetical protein
LQAIFGRLAIRSAYRSPRVNAYGCRHRISCASNEKNRARHIWDQRSRDGGMGAVTSVVVPWLIDRLDQGIPWEAMAWWIHDHLPYSDLQFFPRLAAFNIGWHAREVFAREGERWVGTLLTGDAVLAMPEIGIDVPLAEFYEGLEFTARGLPAAGQ